MRENLSAVNTNGAGMPTQVWQQFTYQGFGTSNSTKFTFLSGDPPNDFSTGFDSVVISTTDAVVPEPMTVTLFGAGLVGAGVFHRRKRKKA